MKFLSVLLIIFSATFSLGQKSDIEGMALSCDTYTVQTTNTSDQSRSAKDTVKSKVIIAINTLQKFIYIKGIEGDYNKNYTFKEIKTTEFVKEEGLDNLGYRTRKSFYFSFPYVADENVSTNFASITYNILAKRIEFSVTIKNKAKNESKSFKFFVKESTYFSWPHGLVFEKEIAVDKLEMHENNEKKSERKAVGTITVNDTSITIKVPEINITKSYSNLENNKKYLNYAGSGFLISFSNQLYKDPWTVYFYNYNQEAKKFTKAIFLHVKE